MADVYGFDAKGVERIVNTVRTVEGALGQRRSSDFQVPNWQHVRITSTPTGSGSGSGSGSGYDTADGDYRYWPGIVETWDAGTNAVIQSANVWVLDRNDYDLEVGSVYTCRQSGGKRVDWEERPLFVHGQGLSYPRAEETGSGSGSGSGDNCGGGEGRSREITFESTTCVGGVPCTTRTTIRSPLPLDVCVSTPDCSGSGG